MRVTTAMTSLSVINNIQNNLNKLNKTNNMLSTGRKILIAQDDAAGSVKAMGLRTESTEIEQYKRNINAASAVLTETDSSLGQITTTLNRVRELTVKASNSTNDQTSLDAIADEVNQMIEELVNVGNTQVAGKYIFGGYSSKEPPFSMYTGYTDGLTDTENLTTLNGTLRSGINANNVTLVKYSGDDGRLITEISPSVTIPFTISGETAFKDGGDIFKTIIGIRDAMYKSDYKSIQNSIGDIDEIIDNNLRTRSQVGALMNRADRAGDRLIDKQYSVTSLLSQTEDVDVAEATIALNTQKSIHQLSLAVGAKLLQSTLMDYLK